MAEPTQTGWGPNPYQGNMDEYYDERKFKDVPGYVGVTPEMQAAYDAFKDQIGIPQGYTNSIDAANKILNQPGALERLGYDPSSFARNLTKFSNRGTGGIDAATEAAIARNRIIGKGVYGEMTGGIGQKGNVGSTANDPRFLNAANDFMNTQSGIRAQGEIAKEQVKFNRLGLAADVAGSAANILQKGDTTSLLAQQGIAQLELQAHQQQMNDLMASYGMQFELSQLPQAQMDKLAAYWIARGGGPSDWDALIQIGSTIADVYLAFQGLPPLAGAAGGGAPPGPQN